MLLGWPKSLWACDVLHRAVSYLHNQFSVEMGQQEAQANADARVLLLCCSRMVIEDAEQDRPELPA